MNCRTSALKVRSCFPVSRKGLPRLKRGSPNCFLQYATAQPVTPNLFLICLGSSPFLRSLTMSLPGRFCLVGIYFRRGLFGPSPSNFGYLSAFSAFVSFGWNHDDHFSYSSIQGRLSQLVFSWSKSDSAIGIIGTLRADELERLSHLFAPLDRPRIMFKKVIKIMGFKHIKGFSSGPSYQARREINVALGLPVFFFQHSSNGFFHRG